MAKSHSSELLSKLKSSLPKKSAGSHGPTNETSTPLPAPTPALAARAPKLSVSLYQTDLRRLDDIKEFMRSRGYRNLSDSEALRIACRAVEITDRFMDVYRDMQTEDGRRRKSEGRQ